MLSWLVALEAPLYWRLEYDADAKAAELLGAEIILLTLRKLKTRSFDGISFTHPPLSIGGSDESEDCFPMGR
jgi:hypothetical protein